MYSYGSVTSFFFPPLATLLGAKKGRDSGRKTCLWYADSHCRFKGGADVG
jgi:hypothetical protein